MRVVVVGYGVQGKKRKKHLGKECVATVDNKNKDADYNNIKKVSLSSFDAAMLCVPEQNKLQLINYCLSKKKHILVEKPLLFRDLNTIKKIEKKAKANKVFIYTAYNHRFEPNVLKLREIVKLKKLGKLYYMKLFYGNGTAVNVKKNHWRDKNYGVLSDLGSHLIDILIFIFGFKSLSFKFINKRNFENNASDYVVIICKKNNLSILLEVSYCMWKNKFSIDLIGKKGSVHLKSLSKWKNCKLIFRKRVLPSGKPKEKIFKFSNKDQTWKKEYSYFKKNVFLNKETNLNNDLKILSILKKSHSL